MSPFVHEAAPLAAAVTRLPWLSRLADPSRTGRRLIMEWAVSSSNQVAAE